jgi:hypothetical protein
MSSPQGMPFSKRKKNALLNQKNILDFFNAVLGTPYTVFAVPSITLGLNLSSQFLVQAPPGDISDRIRTG